MADHVVACGRLYADRMRLEDESPVMRGGVPDLDRWHDAVLDSLDESNQAVLSVFAANRHKDESDATLFRRIAELAEIPHRNVAIATAGMVRELGLTLEHDDSDGQAGNHFHIVFPAEPTKVEMQGLIGVFSDPFPNPRN